MKIDFQKKLAMPRVVFGAGMLLAVIGFLCPMTKVGRTYVDQKSDYYSVQAKKIDRQMRNSLEQAETEKEKNGESPLYHVFMSNARGYEKKAAAMTAKSEKMDAKAEKMTAKVSDGDVEKAKAILEAAEEKIEAVYAAAYAKCEKYVPDYAAKYGRDADPNIEVEDIDYDTQDLIDPIIYAAEDKEEIINNRAVAKAGLYEEGCAAMNVFGAGVAYNIEGIAYVPAFLWACMIACLAGLVVFILLDSIVYEYFAAIIATGFGIASIVALTKVTALGFFSFSAFGTYLVIIGILAAFAGVVIASLEHK